MFDFEPHDGDARLGIVTLGNSAFLNRLPEFIDVRHTWLRTPAEVIEAAKTSNRRLVLFSNFTSDTNWKSLVPRFERERIGSRFALGHSCAGTRRRPTQSFPIEVGAYESSKRFYRQLLQEFPHVELWVMTFAALEHLATEEILALGPGKRIHVRRLDLNDFIGNLEHAFAALNQSGISATWSDPLVLDFIQRRGALTRPSSPAEAGQSKIDDIEMKASNITNRHARAEGL